MGTSQCSHAFWSSVVPHGIHVLCRPPTGACGWICREGRRLALIGLRDDHVRFEFFFESCERNSSSMFTRVGRVQRRGLGTHVLLSSRIILQVASSLITSLKCKRRFLACGQGRRKGLWDIRLRCPEGVSSAETEVRTSSKHIHAVFLQQCSSAREVRAHRSECSSPKGPGKLPPNTGAVRCSHSDESAGASGDWWRKIGPEAHYKCPRHQLVASRVQQDALPLALRTSGDVSP